jgi:hypothetical protein
VTKRGLQKRKPCQWEGSEEEEEEEEKGRAEWDTNVVYNRELVEGGRCHAERGLGGDLN